MIKRLIVLTVLFLVVFPVTAVNQEKKPKEKVVNYAVLMVTGMDKSVSFEYVAYDLEKEFRKDLDKQYREALKSWESAKKEAKKNKVEFQDPKPVKHKLKVLLKGATLEAAKEFKKKAKEEYEAKTKNTTSNISSTSEDTAEEALLKYSVIQIKDMDKTISLDIIEDKKVSDKRKSLDTEYKEAIKDYEVAKKEAKKNKEKLRDPKPSKPELKVLRKGLTMEKAKEALVKAEEDLKKKTASKSNKKKK